MTDAAALHRATFASPLVQVCDSALLDDPRSLLARLVARLDADQRAVFDCWRFTGAHSQSGRRGCFYPVIREGHGSRRVWRVNRLTLILYQGPLVVLRDPGEPFIEWLSRARRFYAGDDASHEVCDRGTCSNPAHLEFTSHAMNLRGQASRRAASRELPERISA